MRPITRIVTDIQDSRNRFKLHDFSLEPDDLGVVFSARFEGGAYSCWLRVVVGVGHGWDHVSVSRSNATPTWAMLEYIKRFVCEPDEVMMQLHVPSADHVNIHPYVLHLWRPHGASIPLPPVWMV